MILSKNYNPLRISSHRLKMEGPIIANCTCHPQTQGVGDKTDATPRFVKDLLKNKITALENELSKNTS